MQRFFIRPASWVYALALLAPSGALHAASLELVQTIPLEVSGRIDHMAIDAEGQRLFVAALGNHTVEVIDLAGNKVVRSLGGFRKPQGVAYSASLHRLFVADGERGVVQGFDATTFAASTLISGLSDADNLRFDAAGDQLYVGYGDGAIRVVDAAGSKPLADVRLPGHPEGFSVARESERVFVNVPDAKQVAVFDAGQRLLLQSWSISDFGANFPVALDEHARRLYVGARRPPTLLAYDIDSGKRVAALPISGDTDDLFVDDAAGRIYVICGEGFIDVIRRSGSDQYEREGRIATRAGARTGLFSSQLKRLYVAVPRRSGSSAEIRVFATR